MSQSRVGELLHLLEERWTQQGANFARLLPGASRAELDAAEDQLGFALPQEVREWFGWHNGINPDQQLGGMVTFPNLKVVGALAYSIKDRHTNLFNSPVDPEDDPNGDLMWNPTWLAITSTEKHQLVADCAGAAQDQQPPAPAPAPAPVHYISWWTTNRPWREPSLPSITAMLEIWWQLTEDGLWSYDTKRQAWDRSRYPEIPTEIKATNIA